MAVLNVKTSNFLLKWSGSSFQMASLITAALLMMMIGAPAANATSIWFTNGNYADGAYHYSEEGTDLTASAIIGSRNGGSMYQSSHGLYIWSYDCDRKGKGKGKGNSCNGDNTHQIDGYKEGEAVQLTFDQEVHVESLYFSYVGYDDDFSIKADTGPTFDYDIVGGTYYDNGSGYFNFAGEGLVGTVFEIAAPYWDDDFKLAGVKFSVSTVPLPPSILMFGAALLGLGYLKRRRKAT